MEKHRTACYFDEVAEELARLKEEHGDKFTYEIKKAECEAGNALSYYSVISWQLTHPTKEI